MSDFSNPNLGKSILPNTPAIGTLAFNQFVFDYAVASYRPSAIVVNDRIQIGTIPAGQVLVPHLSYLAIPQLETGTPASDYTIGTDAVPAALKGTAASETAVTLSGEDFLDPAAPVGHPTEDTPVYIKFITGNLAGIPTTGKIVFRPVTRAWRNDLDG